jgi:hypothetical protein
MHPPLVYSGPAGNSLHELSTELRNSATPELEIPNSLKAKSARSGAGNAKSTEVDGA